MPDRLLVELTIAAPADEVWEAMRDPAKLNAWFGWEAESLPAEIEYIFVTHAKRDEDKRVLFFEGVPDRFELTDLGGRAHTGDVHTVFAD